MLGGALIRWIAFLSYFNSQAVRFNSKYFSCTAVDALLQDWSSDNYWLCPPAHLIVAAVKRLRYHRGSLQALELQNCSLPEFHQVKWQIELLIEALNF